MLEQENQNKISRRNAIKYIGITLVGVTGIFALAKSNVFSNLKKALIMCEYSQIMRVVLFIN